jgi:hypothetical protein
MYSRALFPLALLVLALLAGCDATTEEGTSTLTGHVVTEGGSPIAGATVNVVGTGETSTTDGTGAFSLLVEADSTGDMIPLQVFASGYIETTAQAMAVVDREVSMPDIVLASRTGDGGGGSDPGDGGTDGGPDEGADEPSGPAASITLVQRSSEAIGVQSAGADETATLTFVVLDANGNPVDEAHAVDVSFSIASGPGGGEFIAPALKTTNAQGRVQTTISSGTASGTVQVLATAQGESGEIRSYPVVITIHGGLPDQAHFSVGPAKKNFPGYDVHGLENTITAIVGDIYANPVQPGTAVYFTTNAGVVEGSGTTDALGRTSVQLLSADPLTTGTPPAACPDSDVNGYAVVTARTSDMNQQMIEAHTPVLFSGESEISLIDQSTGADGLGSFRFYAGDRFGHPLSPGTTIDVVADGVNVEAVGDVNVDLGDYLCPGVGRTEFSFSVVQGDEINEDNLPLPPQMETVTITVRSINGDIQLTVFNQGGRPEVVVERLDRLDR